MPRKLSEAKKAVIEEKLRELQTQIAVLKDSGLDYSPLARQRDKMLSQLNPNKYNAKKTEYNGVLFDSKLEADYAKFLDDVGGIPYEINVTFSIMDDFYLDYEHEYKRQKVSRIHYIADFVVADKIIIDIKGNKATQTRAFLNKWKMLKNRYREKYIYLTIESRNDFSLSLGLIKKVVDGEIH